MKVLVLKNKTVYTYYHSLSQYIYAVSFLLHISIKLVFKSPQHMALTLLLRQNLNMFQIETVANNIIYIIIIYIILYILLYIIYIILNNYFPLYGVSQSLSTPPNVSFSNDTPYSGICLIWRLCCAIYNICIGTYALAVRVKLKSCPDNALYMSWQNVNPIFQNWHGLTQKHQVFDTLLLWRYCRFIVFSTKNF